MAARNLILGDDAGDGAAPEMAFNFSLNLAYDIILKSQQSDVLFPEMEVLLIVVYVLLVASGVVSNFLVCYAVMRQCARKKVGLQKSRNLYVVNLAVADLALCCICMPFTLVALVQREWTFGSLLCKLVPVVQGANITVSAGTITAIAFDRYNTIVRSPSSNGLRSGKCSGVVVTILSIWVLSFTVTSPLFFYTVTESVTFDDFFLYEKCIERWPSRLLHSAFTVGLALVQFVIPVLVLTVMHLKISSYLKFHMKPLEKTSRPEIQIHSPNDGDPDADADAEPPRDRETKSDEEMLKKEHLVIERKESAGSESSRKNSECSRKNSDSSRNSCELSPRKRSDFFASFRETSDLYGFSFSRFSDKSTSGKSRKRREIRRNRRTTFILSCIALVYAVSWLPMTIFQIASTLIPQGDQNPKTIYAVFALCHVLAMSSAVSNPLLYGWLNTNFRKEFLHIFACVAGFYSKLLRTETDGPGPGRPKTDDRVPRDDSPPGLERNVSLNYDEGKLTSRLIASPPLPNSRVGTV